LRDINLHARPRYLHLPLIRQHLDPAILQFHLRPLHLSLDHHLLQPRYPGLHPRRFRCAKPHLPVSQPSRGLRVVASTLLPAEARQQQSQGVLLVRTVGAPHPRRPSSAANLAVAAFRHTPLQNQPHTRRTSIASSAAPASLPPD